MHEGCRYISNWRQNNTKLLESLFTEESRSKLIKIFNKLSESELQLTKHLKQSDAAGIVKFRDENGEFQTLSDVLKVPDVDVTKLQKACFELEKQDLLVMQETGLKLQKVYSHPRMTAEQCLEVDSLIAIDVQSDRMTWAKINRNLEVTDWQQTMIFDKSYLVYDHVVYQRKIAEVTASLPDTDIYVMEKKIRQVSNMRYVSYMTNLRILEAVVATMLNTENTDKVFMLKSFPVSNLFNLIIGGERISGKQVVNSLINRKCDTVPDVTIPHYVTSHYNDASSVQQEQFASALLLGLAFYKLVVFKS